MIAAIALASDTAAERLQLLSDTYDEVGASRAVDVWGPGVAANSVDDVIEVTTTFEGPLSVVAHTFPRTGGLVAMAQGQINDLLGTVMKLKELVA